MVTAYGCFMRTLAPLGASVSFRDEQHSSAS